MQRYRIGVKTLTSEVTTLETKVMNGKKLKELISRIPDDAEVVHLWNGGFAWRKDGGLHAYSFKPDLIIGNE